MAMNKREQAEMSRLRLDLRMARALRWPDRRPEVLDTDAVLAGLPRGGIATGWWFNLHTEKVGEGCFSAHFHSRHRTDKVDVQTRGGPWFATKRDALIAMRQAVTEQTAARLAEIDALIEAEEDH